MSLLEEMQRYVGFSEADSAALQALLEPARGSFATIADHFYACILEHPTAHAAITGGDDQVRRLKATLVDWMASGLAGPHDAAFYERRARIGRRHVRIGLPQHFMFTAMNVMRRDFHRLIERTYPDAVELRRAAIDAVDRLFDLELAIMLQTYREDSEDRLRRTERLATIGQLAANIGHDLRNPLGVIESSVYILNKRVERDEKTDRHMRRISEHVASCNRIVTDLLEMVRDRPPRRDVVGLRDLVDAAIQDVKRPEGVVTNNHVPADLTLVADSGLLRQVLVNVLLNGVQAIESRTEATGSRPSGAIDVHAAMTANGVELEVLDDGPGFPLDDVERVFEPLVTSRVKGTGLGLALVRRVIERHGGVVTADNRPEGGARLRMVLPHA
jgi:signal transduction histidine kinase